MSKDCKSCFCLSRYLIFSCNRHRYNMTKYQVVLKVSTYRIQTNQRIHLSYLKFESQHPNSFTFLLNLFFFKSSDIYKNDGMSLFFASLIRTRSPHHFVDNKSSLIIFCIFIFSIKQEVRFDNKLFIYLIVSPRPIAKSINNSTNYLEAIPCTSPIFTSSVLKIIQSKGTLINLEQKGLIRLQQTV